MDEFHALWKKMGKWTTGTVRIFYDLDLGPAAYCIVAHALSCCLRQAIEYAQSSVVASVKQQSFGIRPELATGILIGSVSWSFAPSHHLALTLRDCA